MDYIARCVVQYYFNPAGQRFRSRQEIARHLETAAQQSKNVPRGEAVSNAKAAAEKLDKPLPLVLDNGVRVARSLLFAPVHLSSLSLSCIGQDSCSCSITWCNIGETCKLAASSIRLVQGSLDFCITCDCY